VIRLDGKIVSETRREALKAKIAEFFERTGVRPGLAVVLIGDDPASQVYVGSKIKSCQEVGIQSFEYRLKKDVSSDEVRVLIRGLNDQKNIHGILVQLPLPQHLNEYQIMACLDVEKDVDGLRAESMGYLWTNQPRVIPCTPAGVMAILEYYQISLKGIDAVVIGRSNIVGKPMAHLLISSDATVTVCHSRTKDLRSYTREADLVVAAAGQSRFLGRDDFKKNSVIVDVGIHRQVLPDGKSKLCGDVRYEELEGWARAATPVPGGVGPMTITMLLENTLRLAELAQT
jgi:methylenetetrahydrofolate dehydrogenase (NADP+)/methenyltetrahydrofolate cyclohydrolase